MDLWIIWEEREGHSFSSDFWMGPTTDPTVSPWTNAFGSFPRSGLICCWSALLEHPSSYWAGTYLLGTPNSGLSFAPRATLGKSNPSFIFLNVNSFLGVLKFFSDMSLAVKGNPWHFWCLQRFSWSQQKFLNFEKLVWSLKVTNSITWTPCNPMRLTFQVC